MNTNIYFCGLQVGACDFTETGLLQEVNEIHLTEIVVCVLPANEKQTAVGMQENQNIQKMPVYIHITNPTITHCLRGLD